MKNDLNIHSLTKQLGRRKFLNRLDVCENLYKKDLFGHYGCINAMEFSQDGELLVSGGDDKRILLWNCNEITHLKHPTPVIMKESHLSNIYSATFDAEKLHIFSSGNDAKVLRHNISRQGCTDSFDFEEPVYAVNSSPESSAIFVTAGEDGTIQLCDVRTKNSRTKISSSAGSFHCVAFNPTDSRLLASGNSLEGVALWDVRCPKRTLIQYDHDQSKNAMSVKFDFTGTKILSLVRKSGPILYNIKSRSPIAHFDDRKYRNICTLKGASYAGNKDQYVIAGSDDFDIYVWEVPSDKHPGLLKIDKAHSILNGHRSIVNQVRYNHKNCLLVSAGVEKVLKVWSPFRSSHSSGDVTGEEHFVKRAPYTHEQYVRLLSMSGEMNHNYDLHQTEEDPRMLAFFDSLVERTDVDSSANSSDNDASHTNMNNNVTVLRLRSLLRVDAAMESSEQSSSDDAS